MWLSFGSSVDRKGVPVGLCSAFDQWKSLSPSALKAFVFVFASENLRQIAASASSTASRSSATDSTGMRGCWSGALRDTRSCREDFIGLFGSASRDGQFPNTPKPQIFRNFFSNPPPTLLPPIQEWLVERLLEVRARGWLCLRAVQELGILAGLGLYGQGS